MDSNLRLSNNSKLGYNSPIATLGFAIVIKLPFIKSKLTCKCKIHGSNDKLANYSCMMYTLSCYDIPLQCASSRCCFSSYPTPKLFFFAIKKQELINCQMTQTLNSIKLLQDANANNLHVAPTTIREL